MRVCIGSRLGDGSSSLRVTETVVGMMIRLIGLATLQWQEKGKKLTC